MIHSACEPVGLRSTVPLVEAAARDLEPLLEVGHCPSWLYSQVPDGLALCVRCWKLITSWQLGSEPCPRAGTQAGEHEVIARSRT